MSSEPLGRNSDVALSGDQASERGAEGADMTEDVPMASSSWEDPQRRELR